MDPQQQLGVAIAMLRNEKQGNTDLVEVLCTPDYVLTRTAQQSGLTAERWTMDDV